MSAGGGDRQSSEAFTKKISTADNRRDQRFLRFSRLILRILPRPLRFAIGGFLPTLFEARRRDEDLLPLLIKLFAYFTKSDGHMASEEIDSALSYFRYDFAVHKYADLRKTFELALSEEHDVDNIAKVLRRRLSLEDKIVLGVQLYSLLAANGVSELELEEFLHFMTLLGVKSQGVDIAYQLDVGSGSRQLLAHEPVLESVSIGQGDFCDVRIRSLPVGSLVVAFRFRDFVLVKNTGKTPIIAHGHKIVSQGFSRLFSDQRLIVGDFILYHRDLLFYFSAKSGHSHLSAFVSANVNGKMFIEKQRSRHSILELIFGLQNYVVALRKSTARVNGRQINKGDKILVALHDRIEFGTQTLAAMIDIRRRLAEVGERFDISPQKTEFLVTNNPNLAKRSDVLLTAGLAEDTLLRIRCHPSGRSGELEVLQRVRPLVIDGQVCRENETLFLNDGARIALSEAQSLWCYFSERVLQEDRTVIKTLQLKDLCHSFLPGVYALDNINLTIKRGEMICVMGPSGCGKSLLLRCLAGHLRADSGDVLINDVSFYKNVSNFSSFISYSPHEDTYDPLLTVEENMSFSAAIRLPNVNYETRSQRVHSRLGELGLFEQSGRIAGDEMNKRLSGGERKRLNIGLDLIGDADVFLFDEPTSGLSSKDSEHILEILRGISHNKITIVSIHQPSSRLFHMFDKALLMDKGGKIAYYGKPADMIEYFKEACRQELFSQKRAEFLIKENANSPDFIFDILETPLRDFNSEIIYEEDIHGYRIPSRRFTPEFWRDRFQSIQFYQKFQRQKRESETAKGNEAKSEKSSANRAPELRQRVWRDHWTILASMSKFSFLSKLRNRSNLITTLIEAPLLALLVAGVLRYSEGEEYHFAAAFHIHTYLFLSLVVAMFLGLTNSVDEVIRDNLKMARERNHSGKFNVICYIIAKYLTLSIFAFTQCIIFQIIAHPILNIHAMFAEHLLWMYLSSLMGITLGLIISSKARNIKTALNLIPVILIPQIILGGALIKYEEMNKNIDLVHYIRTLLGDNAANESSELKVPFICEFMPLRWTYEAAIITQATRNPVALSGRIIDKKIASLKTKVKKDPKRIDEIRQLLNAKPYIVGAVGKNPDEVYKSIQKQLNDALAGKHDVSSYPDNEEYHATELYVNRKIMQLFEKAEIARVDMHAEKPPNVFFGKSKRLFNFEISSILLNFSIIILLILVFAGANYQLLKGKIANLPKS